MNTGLTVYDKTLCSKHLNTMTGWKHSAVQIGLSGRKNWDVGMSPSI